MNIVSSATNLETIYGQSEVAVKKLQAEWHRAFISINETLGGIEDKKARAEGGEKIVLDAQLATGPVKSGGMSQNTKTILIIVVVIAALAGLFFFTPLGDTYRDSFDDFFGG